ncbi:hypothetical protein HNQ60_002876 [Povalibacter uvarum]|uniref:Uncharacterized protein n=1 Tax=Povalibacter uvarum TaxID=732238 RepID=A0A841HQ06_9GAMM|nr:hypothetical protein [Povalibacter uvarum]MBB6093995.1 hypothetical protein [Povalibacter uvarum]
MFVSKGSSRTVQRAVCLLLSVVIVAGSFSAWAYGAERDSHPGYSITITQLQ